MEVQVRCCLQMATVGHIKMLVNFHPPLLPTVNEIGIGADAARHLASLRARVAIVGRNSARLNAVADEIRSAHPDATPLAIVADINTDTERIVHETIQHFGQLNVLVNNAGIVSQGGPLESIDIDAFDRIMNTNLRSVIKLTKLAVPHLERTKGNVVNISSIAGLRPIANMLSYCISKSALDQFTKCAAFELASKGIRVNSVNPGIIDTPIFQTLGIDREKAEQYFEIAKKNYPLGRVGDVKDTSATIAYLASDNANFITGVILPVDGGKLLSFTD